jgi:hypothetical protein
VIRISAIRVTDRALVVPSPDEGSFCRSASNREHLAERVVGVDADRARKYSTEHSPPGSGMQSAATCPA